MTDEAQSERVAAEILSEYTLPQTYDQAVALLAYTYARGNRDGYQEGAETAVGSLHALQLRLSEAVKS